MTLCTEYAWLYESFVSALVPRMLSVQWCGVVVIAEAWALHKITHGKWRYNDTRLCLHSSAEDKYTTMSYLAVKVRGLNKVLGQWIYRSSLPFSCSRPEVLHNLLIVSDLTTHSTHPTYIRGCVLKMWPYHHIDCAKMLMSASLSNTSIANGCTCTVQRSPYHHHNECRKLWHRVMMKAYLRFPFTI